MIINKNGNILEAYENIICQSVNHQGVMGSGLAKQIKDKYPDIVAQNNQYDLMCRNMSFEIIRNGGMVAWYKKPDGNYIASIFGQDKFGSGRRYTDYESLKNGLQSVMEFAEMRNYTIAIPYGIGCGLGGGNWEFVNGMIYALSAMNNKNVSIYKYETK